MHLIIGGAYQGKLDYAKKQFDIHDADVYTCSPEKDLDLSRRCIQHFEEYILFCIRQGYAPNLNFPRDAVILCNDISCGVVPMDAEARLWREETGRAITALSRQAESVTRLFCGLPQKLK